MGGDGIPPVVVKHASLAIFEPVHHLFTLCLSQSYLPVEWRNHHITPIPKSGDKSVVSNYRPISLLSCISKVLEKLVYDRVYDFIIQSISISQFGFVRNRSSLQQLLLYSEYLHAAHDRHVQVDALYLDIRKAFDIVPHDRLLQKLRSIGIAGPLWDFFEAYLSSRRHCVVVDGFCFDFLPVTSGVPQGSILGPLLFIVYINDLSLVPISSRSYFYADDTKLCTRVSYSASLQADLDHVCQWSDQHQLSFNVAKCSLLHFQNASSSVLSSYTLNGIDIPSSTHCRDLGVNFSTDLSWSLHYKVISQRAYGKLSLLRRTFSSSIPVKVKKLLYLSLVRPHLTYCSPVWRRPHYVKDILSLKRIQRRATEFILNDYFSDYRSP